jgi:hypothetical protein
MECRPRTIQRFLLFLHFLTSKHQHQPLCGSHTTYEPHRCSKVMLSKPPSAHAYCVQARRFNMCAVPQITASDAFIATGLQRSSYRNRVQKQCKLMQSRAGSRVPSGCSLSLAMNNNDVEKKTGIQEWIFCRVCELETLRVAVAILGSIGGSMADCRGGEVA